MKNPLRLLQAAVLISAAVIVVLIFQIKPDFPYVSPFYARLIGIPACIFLTIAVFWISSWQSKKSIIYAALVLALTIELIPLGLFVGNNEYPSSYYIDPQGKIVLSTFPGNVFQGKAKGVVNDDVIAAYNWQQGNTKDSSGKPLRFYRVKLDGSILVYDYPVDHGEVLHQLDNTTLGKYGAQQIERAKSFIQESDLAKAKEILKNILDQDPNDDEAYRLSKQIKQREEQAETEKLAAEQAEAERVAREESEKEEASATETTDETTEGNEELAQDDQPEPAREMAVNNHARRNHSRRTYSSNYYSPAPAPDYYAPPRSTYYQQPSSSYSKPAPQNYPQPQPAPRNYPQPIRVVVIPSQPRPSHQPVQPSQPVVIQAEPERKKKGMSWKKKLGIAAAIIGGAVVVEEIIRRN